MEMILSYTVLQAFSKSVNYSVGGFSGKSFSDRKLFIS